MDSTMGQPRGAVMKVKRTAPVLLALCVGSCAQPKLLAPLGARTEQSVTYLRPGVTALPTTTAVPATAPEAGLDVVAPPAGNSGTASISRAFRVILSGHQKISVNPWFIKGRPEPTKLSDLDTWVKEWNDRDPARPEDGYTLWIKDDASLHEFANAVDAFASRGFVHPVALVGSAELDFYSGYTPREAISPVGTSLATLNIVVDRGALYVTTIMMRDQFKHEVIEDKRFGLDVLEQSASEALASHLRRVCDHQRRPCDRISFSGLREAPVVPFLGVLALIRQLLPSRPPVVTQGTTVKAGIAKRYRNRGSSEFLAMEGLIDQQERDSHP